MVDLAVISDICRQRKLQYGTGCLALLGIGLWYFGVTVYAFSPGEYIAALAIIIFAVATIHWVDDEEKLEEEEIKK
jgi:hypothetical protein